MGRSLTRLQFMDISSRKPVSARLIKYQRIDNTSLNGLELLQSCFKCRETKTNVAAALFALKRVSYALSFLNPNRSLSYYDQT